MSESRHLAQLNIGRFRFPTDDPRMADFMNNLDLVNALAERSKGFVWHVEALERFVWQTIHKRFYGRRPEWFDTMDAPHFVMWWIPAGHLPTLEEAKERLAHLTAHGPSDQAFGWESVPAAQLWKTARCTPDGKAA